MHALAGPMLAVAVASGGAADPDPGWHRARSAHFEILTDAGEPLARHAAERLERLRAALETLFPPRTTGERRIVAMLLARRSSFEPLVPRRHAQARKVAGFFQGGGEWDTIVAQLSLERRGPFAVLDHEYAHIVLNRSLPAQPLWVAEGLAELLSDASIDGPEVRLGAMQDDLTAHARASALPLSSLIGLRHDSPEYLGASDDASLYARSWALARWVVARHGLSGLRAFLEAVAEGRDARDAFDALLAPLEQAQASLLDVPQAPLLRVTVASATSGAIVPPQVDTPTRAELEHGLGELLLRAGEPARARVHLERALAGAPDHVPTRIALAELHLRTGRPALARREVERALGLSPGDPAALLYDARLRVAESRAAGEPLDPALEDRLVSQLEHALERAAGLYEAALLLVELRPQPYSARRAALEPVLAQDPGRTEVALAVAALYVKERNLAAAQRILRRAREAASEPAYRFLCEYQLEQIADYQAATVEVRGRLLHLECRADGSLRFTVDAPPTPFLLEAASSRSFLVYGDGEASGESELVCGLQDRPLVVRYRRSDSEEGGVQGHVLWLSFPRPEPAPGGRHAAPRTRQGRPSR